jgi:hypothetical protein
VPIPGSTRTLSAASTNPAQVGFRDGGAVVSERAAGPFLQPSSGPTPFGFAIDKRNTLLVSEAGAGGGASSYRITNTPTLQPVSSVMTGQRAACWAVITRNGRYGYAVNAGTGNISGFSIAKDGAISLLDAGEVTAQTGGNPTDAVLSGDSQRRRPAQHCRRALPDWPGSDAMAPPYRPAVSLGLLSPALVSPDVIEVWPPESSFQATMPLTNPGARKRTAIVSKEVTGRGIGYVRTGPTGGPRSRSLLGVLLNTCLWSAPTRGRSHPFFHSPKSHLSPSFHSCNTVFSTTRPDPFSDLRLL